METQSLISAGVVPALVVEDAKAAIGFYERAFGAVEMVRQTTPDRTKIIHASMALNGGTFFLSDEFPEVGGGRSPERLGGSSVTLHLDVGDVDTAFDRAVAAGATVEMALADAFWGARYGKLRDPFGHVWSLSTQQRAVSEGELAEGSEEHAPPRPPVETPTKAG